MLFRSAASEGYFGKKGSDLTLAEAALLAGIPQSPARYDPFSSSNIDANGQLIPDGWAKYRQGEVLTLMVRRGAITQAQADEALAAPLKFETNRFEIEAPHFVLGRVAEELRKRFGESALRDQGLEVTTTLDLNLQHEAERIVGETLTDFGDKAEAHNGAYLAIDPKNADALAYRANAERETGQMDMAERDAHAAVELDNKNLTALLERGIIARLKDHSLEARADWERVIALAPESAEATAARGHLERIDVSAEPATKAKPAKEPKKR